MQTELEDYIFKFRAEQRDLLLYLYDLLKNEYQLNAKISYGIPMFGKHFNIAYLNPLKTGAVDLCFMDGQALESAHLLDQKKRKRVAGMELKQLESLQEDKIRALILEGIAFDQKRWNSKK